ncbi:Rieske (2Fe-2S) protein [Amycolatopsis sp. AA4]|uniref:Rieske (2Fe-2S) protein n=1 Tax=Actinomycetes TaxID=1760 RepID=UPI0001B545B3|nr:MULTISPECIES: Rieske (2Fe-2S) protein [Actinomycetes]ATY13006.1 Rieske (2Fe-2S) protein [Amycolatopsis sp. AA4]EFL08875.1 nitrite reductase small subunit [Streptomyces sp. AA4]
MTATGAAPVVVASSTDIEERGRLIVDIGTTTIGIFRLDGELYAYHNVCPHQGGPACQGRIVPRVRERIDPDGTAHGMYFDESEMHVVCPWHGSEFVIKTGEHAALPNFSLAAVPVYEDEGTVYVSL